jgi:hypothetical protein
MVGIFHLQPDSGSIFELRCYNSGRYLSLYLFDYDLKARKEGENKFRYETTWQMAGAVDGSGNKKAARPTSASFAIQNPGRKLSRTPSEKSQSIPSAAEPTVPRSMSPPKPARSAAVPSKAPRATSGPKIKRTEMI